MNEYGMNEFEMVNKADVMRIINAENAVVLSNLKERSTDEVLCAIASQINGLQTIEAEPVKHAKWESWGYVFHGIEWKRCSACNKCAGVSYYGLLDGKIKMETPAMCGCCGARMDGGAENG